MFNKGPADRFSPSRAFTVLGLVVVSCLLFTPRTHSQSPDKSDKPSRRVVRKVDADYPLDLQRAHIGGVVRLDVLVNSSGTVDSVSVVGGNPVLVETAVRAVKKWKWVPADSATVLRINVNFDADKRNGPSVE